mgnify:CR=1 FL=1
MCEKEQRQCALTYLTTLNFLFNALLIIAMRFGSGFLSSLSISLTNLSASLPLRVGVGNIGFAMFSIVALLIYKLNVRLFADFSMILKKKKRGSAYPVKKVFLNSSRSASVSPAGY